MSHQESWFHRKLYPHRFGMLLAALLCIFVVNIFFPENIYGGIAQAMYLPFLLLSCFVVFESKRRILYLMALVAACLFVSRILNLFFSHNIETEMAVMYIIFFGGVFVEVLRQIYATEMGPLRMVMAAICGLLLIGYWGFYVFLAIEYYQPGSFNNLSQGMQAVNDLFYFSYITILTVGYGYITPKTWIARNATILIAFIAYIYSWVVIATIVSEAMAARQNLRQHKEHAHEPAAVDKSEPVAAASKEA